MPKVVENKMVKLYRSEDGQGMVEYSLVIVLVAIVVIGGLITLGEELTALYQELSARLSDIGN
ncbi:Flp family type IVb pilin [Natranaerobius thermophilus]|uniref:Flp/Fap pilin component n=1 Tax=Natranaerobius thermophilus (strain ATCC BAA-1301 / DSM 18059 / JW/NM-WN-LF) TaxID=457570 RepID=B2A8K3_NATTJ|nr:Flp family type IVb pilin [Natranaerobius thermophilus]ACB85887.1 Flp/Fap pilin component [Natranaerobius thermophilus JW/NM-WN-LF]